MGAAVAHRRLQPADQLDRDGGERAAVGNLALDALRHQVVFAQHVVLARRWFESHTPVDTEERTYKLLGLKWSGGDRASLSAATRDLARTQEADGGWASLDGRESDAYSTAQALVALHDARDPDEWITRKVSIDGVITVAWQQISVGKHRDGRRVDVHVLAEILEVWDGNVLIKTVQRTSKGVVRKKRAQTD